MPVAYRRSNLAAHTSSYLVPSWSIRRAATNSRILALLGVSQRQQLAVWAHVFHHGHLVASLARHLNHSPCGERCHGTAPLVVGFPYSGSTDLMGDWCSVR